MCFIEKKGRSRHAWVIELGEIRIPRQAFWSDRGNRWLFAGWEIFIVSLIFVVIVLLPLHGFLL